MLLERAEVEHLLAVAEVGREQIAAGTPTVEAEVGAHSGIGATEGGSRAHDVCLLASVGDVMFERDGVCAELLGHQVTNAGIGGSVKLDDGNDELGGLARTAAFEHVDRRTVGGANNGVWASEASVDVGVDVDDDWLLDVVAPRYVDDNNIGRVGVVQVGNGVERLASNRVEQCFTVGVFADGRHGGFTQGVGGVE